MKIPTYQEENGQEVDLSQLGADRMVLKPYIEAHKGLIIPCHDIFVQLQNEEGEEGILLVNRDNLPAKDVLWPLGGRIERGMNAVDSIRAKVKEESGLGLKNIEVLGVAQTRFSTDPFGHGKGTDSINIVYFAEGDGESEVKLDDLHSEPVIVTPWEFATNPSLRESLDEYVMDFIKPSLLRVLINTRLNVLKSVGKGILSLPGKLLGSI